MILPPVYLVCFMMCIIDGLYVLYLCVMVCRFRVCIYLPVYTIYMRFDAIEDDIIRVI